MSLPVCPQPYTEQALDVGERCQETLVFPPPSPLPAPLQARSPQDGKGAGRARLPGWGRSRADPGAQ